MNYIISEKQLSIILSEEKESKLTNSMKSLNSFAKNIINRVIRVYNINLKFLLKWGSAIGGLVAPLDNYIKNGDFNLTQDQTALILVGVVCTFFFENKKVLKDVLVRIKEEGLLEVFKNVLTKGEELKKAFVTFLGSLNLTFSNMVEMVSYAFLIPIVTDLVDAAHGTQDIFTKSQEISERLLASGGIILVGTILTEVIKKILKRFSS